MIFSSKCLLKSIVGLLTGFVIGGSIVFYYQGTMHRDAAFAMIDYEFSQLQNESVKAFEELHEDASIVMQNQLINYLQYRGNMGWLDDTLIYKTRGLAKARIAVTLIISGKDDEANNYYQAAFEDLQKSGFIMDKSAYEGLIAELKARRLG